MQMGPDGKELWSNAKKCRLIFRGKISYGTKQEKGKMTYGAKPRIPKENLPMEQCQEFGPIFRGKGSSNRAMLEIQTRMSRNSNLSKELCLEIYTFFFFLPRKRQQARNATDFPGKARR